MVSPGVSASAGGGQRPFPTPRPVHRPQARPDKTRLKSEDYWRILDWLENPDNFTLLHGVGGRNGGKYTSKITVFRQMLGVLHDRGFPKEVSTGENLRKRFNRYVTKYKEALVMKNGSGSQLSEVEVSLGMTLEDKLNKHCPHFERIHALYGERANVAPPGLVLGVLGVSNHDEVYYDPADEGAPEEEADDIANELEEERPGSPEPVTQGITFTDIANEMLEGAVDDSAPDDEPLQKKPMQTEPMQTEVNSEDPVSEPTTSQANASPARIPASLRGQSHTQPIPAVQANARTPNQSRPGKRPAPATWQATSKPDIAQMYAEKMSQKQDFRQALLEAKDKWKTQDLEDRRQARAEAAWEAEKRDRAQRLHEEKKARLEREHQLQLIRHERKTQLLLELIKSNRSLDEMSSLLSLIETDNPE